MYEYNNDYVNILKRLRAWFLYLRIYFKHRILQVNKKCLIGFLVRDLQDYKFISTFYVKYFARNQFESAYVNQSVQYETIGL